MNKNSQGLALWPYIEDRIKHLWMPGLIFLEWEINDVSVGRRKWLPNKEHVYMVTMTKKENTKNYFFFHLSTCGFILFFCFVYSLPACLSSNSTVFSTSTLRDGHSQTGSQPSPWDAHFITASRTAGKPVLMYMCGVCVCVCLGLSVFCCICKRQMKHGR